ncbi:MAG: hypothetical protein ACKV22_36255 [Bryobacteraceae bacterium]
MIRKAVSFRRRLDFSPRGDGHNAQSLALPNRSRIVAVPGTEDTIRGFSAVDLLLLDEAARIPNSLYYSVRPMLAASSGVILAMSTPAGCRGFFHQACTAADGLWEVFTVPATACPRIPPAFLDEERRVLSEWWFRQEYMCDFVPLSAGLFDPRDLAGLLSHEVLPL